MHFVQCSHITCHAFQFNESGPQHAWSEWGASPQKQSRIRPSKVGAQQAAASVRLLKILCSVRTPVERRAARAVLPFPVSVASQELRRVYGIARPPPLPRARDDVRPIKSANAPWERCAGPVCGRGGACRNDTAGRMCCRAFARAGMARPAMPKVKRQGAAVAALLRCVHRVALDGQQDGAAATRVGRGRNEARRVRVAPFTGIRPSEVGRGLRTPAVQVYMRDHAFERACRIPLAAAVIVRPGCRQARRPHRLLPADLPYRSASSGSLEPP